MEENIKKVENLIERCKECKFATCEQCEINWNEVQAIKKLLEDYKELEDICNTPIGNLRMLKKSEYIPVSKIKEVLGLEEDMTEEKILDYIDILVSENNRLEDIEDRKVQIEYNNVFNKGVKSVEKKIREIFERNIKKETYFGATGYHFSFEGCQTLAIEIKKLLQEGDK